MFNSPLRYPGGKNKLAAFVAKICIDNKVNGHYVEPYSGGASVALFLLIEGIVNRITINDLDRSIYAFWYSVLNYTEELCNLIDNTEINIENWHIQRKIQGNKHSSSLLELGFSTLYLNRTNRSGIINGGVIGGQEQSGEYKVDCRFNKSDIKQRVKTIAKYKNRIRLLQMDAIGLVDLIQNEPDQNNTLFYFDPPYYLKANSLYMNYYKNDNHLEVSNKIKKILNIKWIVSYDNVPEINQLYSNCSKKEYSFNHTAGPKKLGKELLFFSPQLILPDNNDWNPINFRITRLRSGLPNIRYKVRRKRSIDSIQTSLPL